MIKVMSLLKRAEGMSKEDFDDWVVNRHVEFAKQIPGLRKYTVSVSKSADAEFDSVNSLYFDDEDARAAGFGSEQGAAAAGDAGAHTSRRVHLVTDEFEQL